MKQDLYKEIRGLIVAARTRVAVAVNAELSQQGNRHS